MRLIRQRDFYSVSGSDLAASGHHGHHARSERFSRCWREQQLFQPGLETVDEYARRAESGQPHGCPAKSGARRCSGITRTS